MATTDFEARQLLKAYRKGLISDELFEEQMQELRSGTTDQGYSYNGKSYETVERAGPGYPGRVPVRRGFCGLNT